VTVEEFSPAHDSFDYTTDGILGRHNLRTAGV
jgi:hypothetical protein